MTYRLEFESFLKDVFESCGLGDDSASELIPDIVIDEGIEAGQRNGVNAIPAANLTLVMFVRIAVEEHAMDTDLALELLQTAEKMAAPFTS